MLSRREYKKEYAVRDSQAAKKYDYSTTLYKLTETSFDYHVPMTGASELTAYMKITCIPSHTKSAFIYTEAGPDRKHYEKVSRKAGHNVRYFKSINHVMTWRK